MARRGTPPVAGPGRGRLAFFSALSCVLLVSATAEAKPSLAVIPFGRFPVERQLTHALCAEVTCVNSGQVTRQGRIDWERVSAAQLTAILTGRILRDANTHRRFVDIQLVAPGRIILVRKKAPLQSVALSTASLRALSVELVGVLNRAHGPERAPAGALPAAPAPDAATSAPPTSVPPPAARTAEAPLASAAAAELPVSTEVASGPAEVKAEEAEPALLEVQATVALLNRQYSYSSASPSSAILRNSTVPLALEPGVQLALFPVRASSGLFESLGLQAGAAISVGMALQRDNDVSGLLFPANSIAANVAFVTRLRLGQTVRLAPVLGWQMMNFDVHPASDGTALTGQPAVHWRALSAGLKLDVGFTRWCLLYLEVSYLYVYTAGPLTSAAHFPSFSSAPSFDSALGLGFRLSPRIEVRLGAIFTLFALNFGGTGPAPVRGVSDRLLGGTLGFRYTY